jgi:hypothetical protein
MQHCEVRLIHETEKNIVDCTSLCVLMCCFHIGLLIVLYVGTVLLSIGYLISDLLSVLLHPVLCTPVV